MDANAQAGNGAGGDKAQTSALDRLDISKRCAALGIDEEMGKAFVAGVLWHLFDANENHVWLHLGPFAVTPHYLRPGLGLLIGPEPVE